MTYYPIGTVVTLKGGDRPLMIYGRKQIQQQQNLIWDYVACLYPEGNLGEDYNIFFQQEEIARVYHVGLQGEAERRMQQVLEKAE